MVAQLGCVPLGMTLSQFQEAHFDFWSCALLGPPGQGQRKKAQRPGGDSAAHYQVPELMQLERALCCFLGKGWLLPKNRQWIPGRKGLPLLQSSRGGIWTKTSYVPGAWAGADNREKSWRCPVLLLIKWSCVTPVGTKFVNLLRDWRNYGLLRVLYQRHLRKSVDFLKSVVGLVWLRRISSLTQVSHEINKQKSRLYYLGIIISSNFKI